MANNDDAPSYDDLAIFLNICEMGGFRSTAKRLGLSPSSVSEKISRLEQQLGVPLLTRTTRSVAPTDAGQALAARLSPLFAGARVALQDAASSHLEVRGLLRLNVTGAVMTDILPPLMNAFLERHPGVRIECVVEDRLVDAIAAGCDAGIRYGEHLAQDMIAIPIGPRWQWTALAAAPSYLASRGTPEYPHDLLTHDCIRLRFSSGAFVDWEFEKDGRVITVDPVGRLIIGVEAAGAAVDLARSGRGLVYTFENWLAPHFATGALVPVLSEWRARFEGPQLYFSRRFMPAPLRAFVDFISTESKDRGDGPEPPAD
ncbi:LysR family transcriptional regulator [Microvirga sp. BT688]|uniref:LysR family transcriptional regulator n=1 Tax=Microvirga sp. TaxID=1873136 RepID=UPI00168A033C|nr:LysR family transcriptional regulator [Microvirga sp.]MBD2751178.1 LysR family transcriptional regulator [Microvirga sp.]